MQGIITVAANTTKGKQIVFKLWTTIPLDTQTSIPGQLKLTGNRKGGHFSSFSGGFRIIPSRSDVELPRQA